VGHYRKEERQVSELAMTPGLYLEKSEREKEKLRVRQRYPLEGTIVVRLTEGDLAQIAPVKEQPDVGIRGRARRRGNGTWAVTLFLVNEQSSVEKNIDERWLFQAELEVRDPSGRAIFLECGSIEGVPAETDAERAQLAMLYRNEVEFAVGHGTAVRIERSRDDGRRAVAIAARNIPVYELARTDQPEIHSKPALTDVEPDMQELSKTCSRNRRDPEIGKRYI
jgi:hypothetical protein